MPRRHLLKDTLLQRWHPYAWIAAAGTAVYLKILSFGFTGFDDHVLVESNYRFLYSPENILTAFRQSIFQHGHFYRPVLTASFILDAQWGGDSAFAYHFTNILLHAAASCLVFFFLEKLKYKRENAFFLTVVFAVHPALTQAVAWIPGRNDSLLTIFALSSFIFFMDFLKTYRARYLVLHISAFTLALFTKESAVFTPLLCLVYLYAIAGSDALSSRRRIMLGGGWLVAMALWWSLRSMALKDAMELKVFDLGKRLLLYSPAFTQFIGKMLFPFRLSVLPILQDTPNFYGYIAIALLVAALILTKKRRYGFILFGASWLALFLLPTFVPVGPTKLAHFLEHRTYLPMVGFLIMWLETGLMKKFDPARRTHLAAAIILILSFSVMAFRHSDNFRDKFSFWENAAATSPHSALARSARGDIYYDKGLLAEAEAEYNKCLGLKEMRPAFYALGDLYLIKNRLDDALYAYQKALSYRPEDSNICMRIGTVWYKKGDLKKAEGYWKKALAIDPDNAWANKNLAIYYCDEKDFEKSRHYARRLQALGARLPEDFLRKIGL